MSRAAVRRGTRFLLLTCFERGERQFRGIEAALPLLRRRPGFLHLPWAGQRLCLRRRRGLAWILVSGHGSREQARITGGAVPPFTPAALEPPPGAALYLAACYQGLPGPAAAWAAGCRLPRRQVRGAPTETDSFLSACLLLHLAERGPGRLAAVFPQWVRANRLLSPHFAVLRASWQVGGGDPARLLADAQRLADLTPVRGFLAIALRHPRRLAGMLAAGDFRAPAAAESLAAY